MGNIFIGINTEYSRSSDNLNDRVRSCATPTVNTRDPSHSMPLAAWQ